MSEPKSVGEILDRICDTAGKGDRVSIGDIVTALGNRGHAPFLVVLPLIELSPIGGIPGVPTALAAVVILIAAQLAIGHRTLWLPGFVQRRSVKSRAARTAARKVRPVARFMDRWFHGRLPFLTRGPAIRIVGAMCVLLALTVPPLEVLPFASSAPMLAIASFGLALLVRDGLLMIVAGVLSATAIALGIGLLRSTGG